MRNLGYSTPYPAAASSPYYTGQAYGSQIGQTAASAVRTVVTPAVGFWQGLTGGYGVLIGLGIIAVVLINARES
jgi:hypothetical protein